MQTLFDNGGGTAGSADGIKNVQNLRVSPTQNVTKSDSKNTLFPGVLDGGQGLAISLSDLT